MNEAIQGRLITLNISQIKPYYRNPRTTDNVQTVVESIRRYGYVVPITVDKKNTIVSGHTRLKALMELGYKKVKVIVLDGLSSQQIKEFRLLDNETSAQSSWDKDMLAVELKTLKDALGLDHLFKTFSIPTIVKDSIGVTLKDVDLNAMEKAQEKIDAGVNASGFKPEMVEVICPECGHEFYLSKADVE